MRYMDSCCKCKEVFEPHGYVFTGKCILTKKEVSVTVPAKELYAYRQGRDIQNAMPSVSADDREFLLSGISGEGWKKTFNKKED